MIRLQTLQHRNSIAFEDTGENNLICKRQAFDKLALKHISAQRVRTWLEDCPKFSPRIGAAKSSQGLANRRWVVGEVIDDRHASDLQRALRVDA